MARRFYVDIQNGKFVAGIASPAEISPAAFVLGDTVDLEFIFLTPKSSPTASASFDVYTVPVGATIELGAKETDDFEAATYLAYTDVFTAITDGKACSLDLNTTELHALFATTDDSKEVNFEISITPSGGEPTTPIRWLQRIKHQVIDNATAPTPAGPTYLTQAQTEALIKGGASATLETGKTTINSGVEYVDVTFGITKSGAWHFDGLPCLAYTGSSSPAWPTIRGVSDITTSGFRLWLTAPAEISGWEAHWRVVIDA